MVESKAGEGQQGTLQQDTNYDLFRDLWWCEGIFRVRELEIKIRRVHGNQPFPDNEAMPASPDLIDFFVCEIASGRRESYYATEDQVTLPWRSDWDNPLVPEIGNLEVEDGLSPKALTNYRLRTLCDLLRGMTFIRQGKIDL